MPFSQPLATMTYSLQLATASDLPELAEIMVQAMASDQFWGGVKGTLTYQEELKFTYETLLPRFVHGPGLGAYETWTVVDENGKILAWGGLVKPCTLTDEERALVTSSYDFPECRNQGLYEVFRDRVYTSSARNGCDPSKHFQRNNTMVRPEYQRQGLGRLITEKLNEIADAAGAATYVRARPGAAGLLVQMGYETLETMEFDLGDYGVEGGKTACFCMRREPGAKDVKGKKLDWS